MVLRGSRAAVVRAIEAGGEHVVASFDAYPDRPPRRTTLSNVPDLWFLDLSYVVFRLFRTRDSDLTRFMVVTDRRLLIFRARRWKRWCFVPERQGSFAGAITAFEHGHEPSISCWDRRYFFSRQLYDFVFDLVERSQGPQGQPPPPDVTGRPET